MTPILLAITLCFAAAAQGVIDRVAVVVGNDVITESEVLRELRLTQFLNGQPLDLNPAQRRAAAERMVDQLLIRNEMQVGGFQNPPESEGDALLRSFVQQNYRSPAEFRAALEKYGVTEDELKRHLLWQTTALRFTDQRFRMTVPAPPPDSADRSKDPDGHQDTVQDQMEVWLKQARAGTRIQFKEGAFR